MVGASANFSKDEFFLYSKQGIQFFHRLTITYFKNTSFGHIMAYLSETYHPSKAIFYLIKII